MLMNIYYFPPNGRFFSLPNVSLAVGDSEVL